VPSTITKAVRQDIFDAVRISNVFYAGRLNDVEFLSRLFDLHQLPSYDSRYQDAYGDIWQHTVNNDDYERDWIFVDPRFALTSCADQDFLSFLCETLHPVVRSDQAEVMRLVGHYNEQLAHVGWELIPERRIAGRSIFVASSKQQIDRQLNRARSAAEVLSNNWMQSEVLRIQNAIDTDPGLAVGTAKDLIESCCKSIIASLPDAEEIEKTDDLAKLTRKMCKALGLLPESVSNEAKGSEIIKRTLSNLAQVTKGIAELRGLYGSGHGKDSDYRGLEPRHARLAASCAIAFVDFATETYEKKKRSS